MTPNFFASSLSDVINDLPSPSPVLRKFSSVAANPASSAEDMAKVVKLDPALTGKVLRLANSAYTGIPNAVASLKNAVVLLGQKRIYSLVLASGLLSVLKKKSTLPFRLNDYWRHSVSVASIAEAIAKLLRRYDHIDSDEAFTAGLLHDIGKLVVGCFDAKLLAAAAGESRERGIAFFKAENAETSHTAAGGLLARHWNFPPCLYDAIMCHHAPLQSADCKRMVSVVHVSDILAHIAGRTTFAAETAPEFDGNAIAIVNLQPERLRAIANEAVFNEKTIESFINFIGRA